MAFGKIIKNIFAPEPLADDKTPAKREKIKGLKENEVTVNEILDALHNHFLNSVKKLSSKYNLLYHTSFTIYIKAANYKEISDSLPFMASGAEKMLVEEIKRQIKNGHPNHCPHSQYWQFQLVEIPSCAEIDGMTEEEMQDAVLIQIHSSLFPPAEGGDEPKQTGGRIVTTVQGVNSLRAIKNCINPEILSKLYLIEEDRIKLNLVLEEQSDGTPAGFTQTISGTPKPTATAASGNSKTTKSQVHTVSVPSHTYFATLEAQDGEFLEGAGTKVIHTVAMTADELHIVGRSSMRGTPGIEVVRVNSDRILTPHVKIRRNPATGSFEICAIGETILNGRTMPAECEQWKILPKRSTIILAEEVQIRFKASL